VERRTVLTAITYDWTEDEWGTGELGPLYRGTSAPNLTWDEFWDMYLGGTTSLAKLKDIVNAFGGIVRHILGRPISIYPPQDAIKSTTFYITGTLFSAFHIGAWNWEFSSSIVRTLWRTFALAATGTSSGIIFLIVFYVIILMPKFSGQVDEVVRAIIFFLIGLFAFIYIISRLALMVLIFYCFSSMPAGVYETVDWTKFLPRFFLKGSIWKVELVYFGFGYSFQNYQLWFLFLFLGV
jgi:hypothetical protein